MGLSASTVSEAFNDRNLMPVCSFPSVLSGSNRYTNESFCGGEAKRWEGVYGTVAKAGWSWTSSNRMTNGITRENSILSIAPETSRPCSSRCLRQTAMLTAKRRCNGKALVWGPRAREKIPEQPVGSKVVQNTE